VEGAQGEELSILRTFSIIEEDQDLDIRRGWKMLKVLISLSLSIFHPK
jgi:hypothetical protein